MKRHKVQIEFSTPEDARKFYAETQRAIMRRKLPGAVQVIATIDGSGDVFTALNPTQPKLV